MSQNNVKIVQRALGAFTSRDKDTWCALCDPNVEAIPVGDWPEKTISGRDAVWDFLVAADEPWAPGPYEVAEVAEADEAVAVRLRRDMRGKSSGVEVEYDYWAVFTFRAGRIARTEWFDARGEALEAAGLRE
ncbi:MAG: nuclear transport factor 2 family protein [Solirubrobacterales bacterium]